MKALIVIDAQKEFAPNGSVPVSNHAHAVEAIRRAVERAREDQRPIAWVQHHNRDHDPERFVPGSEGARLEDGLGPLPGEHEVLFVKDDFSAFRGTAMGEWLERRAVDEVELCGFSTHMCVSTTAREALMRGLRVRVNAAASSSTTIDHPQLGRLEGAESHRVALLHLSSMGALIDEAEGRPAPEPVTGRPVTRVWRTRIDPDRADEYWDFAQTVSLPMFRTQDGFLGVFFARGSSGDEHATITFWDGMGSVEALRDSSLYQATVRRIEESGLLVGQPSVEVYEVEAGAIEATKLDRSVQAQTRARSLSSR